MHTHALTLLHALARTYTRARVRVCPHSLAQSEDLARTAEASRASDARVAVLCALAGAAAGAAAARQLGRGAPRLSHVSRFKQSV